MEPETRRNLQALESSFGLKIGHVKRKVKPPTPISDGFIKKKENIAEITVLQEPRKEIPLKT